MRLRSTALIALVTLAAPVFPARAAEKAAAPALVVRLKSIDGLIADARFLAEAAGKGEEAKQGEKFLRSFIGDNGFEGFDTKKPIVFYGRLAAKVEDSDYVLAIRTRNQAATGTQRFQACERGLRGGIVADEAGPLAPECGPTTSPIKRSSLASRSRSALHTMPGGRPHARVRRRARCAVDSGVPPQRFGIRQAFRRLQSGARARAGAARALDLRHREPHRRIPADTTRAG